MQPLFCPQIRIKKGEPNFFWSVAEEQDRIPWIKEGDPGVDGYTISTRVQNAFSYPFTKVSSPSIFIFFPFFFAFSPRGNQKADTALKPHFKSSPFPIFTFFLRGSLRHTHVTPCLAARRLGYTWRWIWTIAFDSYRVCFCKPGLIQRLLKKVCTTQVSPGLESSYRCSLSPAHKDICNSCSLVKSVLWSHGYSSHLGPLYALPITKTIQVKSPRSVRNDPWGTGQVIFLHPFPFFSFLCSRHWSVPGSPPSHTCAHNQAKRGNESFAMRNHGCRILILNTNVHIFRSYTEPGKAKEILANSGTWKQDFLGVRNQFGLLIHHDLLHQKINK